MNSQQLLFLNAVIFVFFVFIFIFGRSKSRQPSRLNLKNDQVDKPEDVPNAPVIETNPVILIEKIAYQPPQHTESKDVTPKTEVKKNFKSVYIMFNGHEWDAFEVLGISKSSDLQQITAHYQKLIKTSDPSTFEFYDAAYTAILKRR